MSVFMNRLRNRVSQATYRPRRVPASRSSDSEGDGDSESSKHRPRTLSEHLEGLFLEEVKEEKKEKD